LAIGALLLGASLVEAVDIDPIAVEVTKENAERNGVSFKASAGEGIRSLVDSHGVTADDVDRARDEWEQDEHPLPAGTQIQSTVPTAADGFQYDVVVSNIISAILIRISHEVAAAVRPGGDWIVSGIIVQNWPDVLAAAERAGFSLEERLEEDGWVAARFLRDSG
jgi:ribosomal protein L11 methyltransferase